MTGLERRYRRVLRLLPADYRAAWEEDMVETFLRANEPDVPEDAEFVADYGRPGAGEVASVVALAVRLRLGGVGAEPKDFTRGEVVRRVALVGLLVQAVAALAATVALPWSQARFPRFVVPDATAGQALAGLVWVAAYLALVLGARRVSFACAGLGVGLGAWSAVSDLSGGASTWVVGYQFLMVVLPVLAMAAFHRDAPPVPVRPWLVALPVGAAVLTGLLVAQTPEPTPVDWPGVLCVVVVVAALVHLVAGRPGSWSAALLVLAVAVLGERVLTVLDYLRFFAPGDQLDLLVAAGVVQGVAVGLVIVPLAVRWAARRSPDRVA